MSTIAPTRESETLDKILQSLDFEVEKNKEDSCESDAEPCDNPATWLLSIKTKCPHDGRFLRVCDFHKRWFLSYVGNAQFSNLLLVCIICSGPVLDWIVEPL